MKLKKTNDAISNRGNDDINSKDRSNQDNNLNMKLTNPEFDKTNVNIKTVTRVVNKSFYSYFYP